MSVCRSRPYLFRICRSRSFLTDALRSAPRPKCHGPTDLGLKLADRMGLETYTIQLGSTEIKSVRPFDVDQVMDYYIFDRKQEQGDPYWAVLWASAVAVSEMILADPSLVRGKRVASVGCGLALDGIVAALAGAAEVDLFDREPRALQCALLSAVASGLSPLTSAASFSTTPEEQEALVQLQAQLKADCDNSPSICTVTASEFDWHMPFIGRPYDVVIACDVLYDASAVDPLVKLLPSMLAAGVERNGWNRLILTDPPERTPKHRADFMEKLAAEHHDMVVDFLRRASVDQHGVSGLALVIALRRKAPGGGDTVGLSPTSIT
eukprot:jgi/Ulvmu1/4626/UM002_0357.1